jgi:hypothetical protein
MRYSLQFIALGISAFSACAREPDPAPATQPPPGATTVATLERPDDEVPSGLDVSAAFVRPGEIPSINIRVLNRSHLVIYIGAIGITGYTVETEQGVLSVGASDKLLEPSSLRRQQTFTRIVNVRPDPNNPNLVQPDPGAGAEEITRVVPIDAKISNAISKSTKGTLKVILVITLLEVNHGRITERELLINKDFPIVDHQIQAK